jgi:hypothetical protein
MPIISRVRTDTPDCELGLVDWSHSFRCRVQSHCDIAAISSLSSLSERWSQRRETAWKCAACSQTMHVLEIATSKILDRRYILDRRLEQKRRYFFHSSADYVMAPSSTGRCLHLPRCHENLTIPSSKTGTVILLILHFFSPTWHQARYGVRRIAMRASRSPIDPTCSRLSSSHGLLMRPTYMR